MKKTTLSILLIPVLALCLVGFRAQGTPPDLSSPKAAVRSFVDALARHDLKAMTACVQGAEYMPEMDKLFDSRSGIPEFEIKDLIAETDNEKARVAAEVTMKTLASHQLDTPRVSISAVEMFQLQKQGDAWHLVPDESLFQSVLQSEGVSGARQVDIRPLSVLVYLVSAPKIALQARGRAMATTCVSNEKQISLGLLMYSQDYDEIFPRKKASYVDLIMPYIKNKDVFTCPLDAKGTISYTLNANIQGVFLGKINAPAQTVLLYEGKNGKLDFRHDGMAAVAFVDGHVKLVSPEAAKELYWYPAGKQPAPQLPAKPIRRKGSGRKK